MTEPWTSIDVSVVLTMTEAQAMFDRAERWDIKKGGRFDRQHQW